MLKKMMLQTAITMCVLIYAGIAVGQESVQKYFNDAAVEVKATTDVSQKRELLDAKLQSMSSALDKVQSSPLASKTDRENMNLLRASLQEKRDELAGTNGYTQVSDSQLNAFSEYIVQDMEQADRAISISLVTALLIVIIIILIV